MTVPVRMGGKEHLLSRDDKFAVARHEARRRLKAYFVEIYGRRYPPKQLIRSATGTRQPFVTAVALRALRARGFDVVAIAAAE